MASVTFPFHSPPNQPKEVSLQNRQVWKCRECIWHMTNTENIYKNADLHITTSPILVEHSQLFSKNTYVQCRLNVKSLCIICGSRSQNLCSFPSARIEKTNLWGLTKTKIRYHVHKRVQTSQKWVPHQKTFLRTYSSWIIKNFVVFLALFEFKLRVSNVGSPACDNNVWVIKEWVTIIFIWV